MGQATKSELVKETKLRSIRFNRFLIFRYITALFFFVNLYWCVFSMLNVNGLVLIPLLLLVVDGGIIYEQTKKYWQPTSELRFTKVGYYLQLGVNSFGLLLVLLGKHTRLFPFINEDGRVLLGVILLVGILLCIIVERRVWKISHNKDSYLNHMAVFAKNVEREG